VSTTGTGESFIRACFGYHVHARLAFSQWSLQRACDEGLDRVKKLGGRGGCIAVDHDGHIVLPFNSKLMFRAWVDAAGTIHTAVKPGDA
jgi:beta-aspartyl-peptidase (threonine type)